MYLAEHPYAGTSRCMHDCPKMRFEVAQKQVKCTKCGCMGLELDIYSLFHFCPMLPLIREPQRALNVLPNF